MNASFNPAARKCTMKLSRILYPRPQKDLVTNFWRGDQLHFSGWGVSVGGMPPSFVVAVRGGPQAHSCKPDANHAFQVACNWAMSCRSSHVIKLKLSSQLIGQFGHVTASASCKQPEKHGISKLLSSW